MNRHEFKRRTDKVDEVINEVADESDPAVATVARAVRDVNETLAVHAAWTEERFEMVDDRLISVGRIQTMTASKLEMQIAGMEAHMVGFGVWQTGIGQTLSKVEQNQVALIQGHMAMFQKVERLEQGQEALQKGQATLVETMHGLTVRVGEVLAFAISDEMKQHMTKG